MPSTRLSRISFLYASVPAPVADARAREMDHGLTAHQPLGVHPLPLRVPLHLVLRMRRTPHQAHHLVAVLVQRADECRADEP
ncbi:hypothetical protein SANTM175S_00418 [Streptomyces antimycoticus]